MDEIQNSNKQVKVYPNPASSVINILVASNTFTNTDKIEIISISGKTIYSSKLSKQHNTFEMNEFPRGVYIVRVHSNNYTEHHKFIYE